MPNYYRVFIHEAHKNEPIDKLLNELLETDDEQILDLSPGHVSSRKIPIRTYYPESAVLDDICY